MGLSISREITRLLGGELTITSEVGKGSTFKLLLPVRYVGQLSVPTSALPSGKTSRRLKSPSEELRRGGSHQTMISPGASRASIPDDRGSVEPGDRVLLIVETDRAFSDIFAERAREKGFKCLRAVGGAEALELAQHHHPDAISLDLVLPDMEGWVLLDRLKHDPTTRHIPVQIMGGKADEKRAYEYGAIAVLDKPVDQEKIDASLVELQALLDRRIKKVLLVEDDEVQRAAVVDLIGADDVEIVAMGDGEEALKRLSEEAFDCMVLDLSLPGMDGIELVQRLREESHGRRLPIIVYTGRELTKEEQLGLSRLAETVIIKDVRSPERLVEEASLFLHRAEASMPEAKRKILRSLVHGDPALQGRHVLIVDDDVRNIFAITAVLEQHDIVVSHAENGQEALDKLNELDNVEAVLMDIMMPEMDGYEAMRRIRQNPAWKSLPMIALTAKAMKGDREKCVEAGASDYVTKPVDDEQLVSLLRVWLYR